MGMEGSSAAMLARLCARLVAETTRGFGVVAMRGDTEEPTLREEMEGGDRRKRQRPRELWEVLSRDVVKQCLEFLDGPALCSAACVSRSCRSGTSAAWPDLARRSYPKGYCAISTEESAKRYYKSQRRRRLLADRAGGSVEAWRRPVVDTLADVTFFVRITDGDRLVWEGDAKGNFEVDHIAVDLRDVWAAAKSKWPHLASLFALRQAHARSRGHQSPPEFIVDSDLERLAFQNVAVSLVAVRRQDDKMCLLAKLTTVERVDMEDLDYALSTQPIETKTFMTFREPAQLPGIQGFLQFWTDDALDADDQFDCLNLFLTAGKISPSIGEFVEDYDLNEDEVTRLFDSFQWT